MPGKLFITLKNVYEWRESAVLAVPPRGVWPNWQLKNWHILWSTLTYLYWVMNIWNTWIAWSSMDLFVQLPTQGYLEIYIVLCVYSHAHMYVQNKIVYGGRSMNSWRSYLITGTLLWITRITSTLVWITGTLVWVEVKKKGKNVPEPQKKENYLMTQKKEINWWKLAPTRTAVTGYST